MKSAESLPNSINKSDNNVNVYDIDLPTGIAQTDWRQASPLAIFAEIEHWRQIPWVQEEIKKNRERQGAVNYVMFTLE
jgi:hypothetical protein